VGLSGSETPAERRPLLRTISAMKVVTAGLLNEAGSTTVNGRGGLLRLEVVFVESREI